MDTTIRPAVASDAPALAAIYNHYIANTCVTFETERVRLPDMEQRVCETLAKRLPWLVAESSGQLVGYAYASEWKGRCAYRFSVESTVYLDPAWTDHGIGTALYSALIDAIRGRSMRTVIGGIALPNDASIRLHERLGFKKVGHFEQVGFKHDEWIDVGYWQLTI